MSKMIELELELELEVLEALDNYERESGLWILVSIDEQEITERQILEAKEAYLEKASTSPDPYRVIYVGINENTEK